MMIHLIKVMEMALKSLTLHKFRSFLSVLGIIFGVMAVVAMLAVGEGAKVESLRQIELLGTNNLIIRALDLTKSEQIAAQEHYSAGLTTSDLQAISVLPGIQKAAALREYVLETNVEAAVKPSIVAVTPEYADIVNITLAEGGFISDEHMARHSRVCVLGAAVAVSGSRRFMPGDKVKIGGDWYTVFGILQDKDYSGSDQATITPRNSNTDIYIPLSVQPSRLVPLQEADAAQRSPDHIDQLWVHAEEAEQVTPIAGAVRTAMERLHRGVKDFNIQIPMELLRQKQHTLRIFNLVLVCIAGISLVVGGIGIMNIMLATVSERTREIGICRAVGACRNDILLQFLSESVVLTLLGGLLGVACGWAGAEAIAAYADWKTVISWESIAAATAISAFVGIFFGMYPAYRAARLDPIVALRFE